MSYDDNYLVNQKPPCRHLRLQPFALVYVRKIYPNGFKESPEYDYSATSLAATELHVKKFICLDCNTIINAPNIYDCAEEEK